MLGVLTPINVVLHVRIDVEEVEKLGDFQAWKNKDEDAFKLLIEVSVVSN